MFRGHPVFKYSGPQICMVKLDFNAIIIYKTF